MVGANNSKRQGKNIYSFSKAGDRSKWQLSIILFFIFIITIIIYINSLNAPLTFWDDIAYVTQNTSIRSIKLSNIIEIFSRYYHTDYQPIQILSYSLDYSFWGLNPVGYHITNSLLHFLNGVLVYLLTLRLVKRKSPALLASLLFIVSPGNVESVAWISERKIVLAVFFMLLSLLQYLDYLDSNRQSIKNYIFCIILFAFSLLSKAAVVIFPLLLIMIDLYRRERSIKNIYINKIPLFIFTIIDSIITIQSQSKAGAIKQYHGGSPVYTFLTMCKVLLHYVKVSVLPINLSTNYDFAISTSIIDLPVISSIVFLICIGYTAYLSFFRKRVLFLCISSFFISIIPVSNVIPISILFAERYLYIPSIFFSIAVGNIFANVIRRGTGYVRGGYNLFIIIAIIMLCILTIKRNIVWNDPLLLWTDAVRKSPNDSSGMLNLGYAYIEKKDYRTAIDINNTAVRLDAGNKKAYNNLGTSYGNLGMYNKAVLYFRYAIRLDHKYLDAIANLGLAYYKKELFDKAIEVYNRYLRLNDKNPSIFYHTGMSYKKIGKIREAEEYYLKALSIDPLDVESLQSLGILYKERGNLTSAIEYYMRVLKIAPNKQDIHFDLGNIYYLMNNKRLALQEYGEELKINQKNSRALFNIGVILYEQKRLRDAIKYLKDTIEIAPSYLNAYLLISLAFRDIGDIESYDNYMKLAERHGIDMNVLNKKLNK